MTDIKVNKGVAILKKMGDFLWEKQLKNVYNAFIKPFTEYGVLVWGGAPKTHLIKIERSLNKAVSIMLLKGKFESAQPLSQYLNIYTRTFNYVIIWLLLKNNNNNNKDQIKKLDKIDGILWGLIFSILLLPLSFLLIQLAETP